MNKFAFESFIINDEQHIEILNTSNFELYLLATTALTFLIKTEEDESAVKDGSMPEFISYTRWAVNKVGELATSKDINVTTPEMQPIAQKVFASIETAKRRLAENPSRLRVGDFNREFWWFYAEAITEILDGVKILKSEHKKVKGSTDEYDHNVRIQFNHGENSWTYNIRIKDNRGIETKGFMNGAAISFQEAVEDKGICEEIVTVNFALKNIAVSIAMEKAFSFLCDIANKEPTSVSRARTIAIVLGGNYRNYLLSAKHFCESLGNVLRDTNMSEDEAARHILNKQLRATESEVTQIIGILRPNNTWR